MEIKDLIKSRRISLNLTMLDVATAVGVSEGTVSRWESGNISNMRRDRMFSLSKVLDISPLQLLDPSINIVTPVPTAERSVEEHGAYSVPERQLVGAYRALNDEGRGKLVDYADDLVASGKYAKTPSSDSLGA